MSELFIRPAHNDHRLLESLLSTSGGARRLRPPLNRLVLDAPIAMVQGAFVQAAEASGTPVLIDPLTFYLQGDVRPDDPWRRLPFSRPSAIEGTELVDRKFHRELVAAVVDFEIEVGATAIVAPYLLIGDDERLVEVNRSLIGCTRELLDRRDIRLPLVTVIAVATAGADAASRPMSTAENLAHASVDVGASNVAIALSGSGGADDRVERVLSALRAFSSLAAEGTNAIAWRQGLIGPSAVASGAIGYECGIGTRERCDLAGLQRSRRPGPSRASFGRPAGVYMEAFGRSVPRQVANVLLNDEKLLPRLVCESESCCPAGLESMLKDPRRHAILTRSRYLSELDRMPSRDWRLNAVARNAESGAVLAELATRILFDCGRPEVVSARALGSIAAAADFLREEGERDVG